MPRKHSFAGKLIAFATLALLAVAIAGVYLFTSPFKAFGSEQFVDIQPGTSSKAIAMQLERTGVIRSRWVFWAIHLLRPKAPLQAGEYRFTSASTPLQVFQKIRQGDVYFELFTIPEGSNIFDIATLLAGGDTVTPRAFLLAAADPRAIRDLDAQAPSLEGYLFPSTYRLTRKTTAVQFCFEMTKEFRRQWTSLAGNAKAVDVHRIVTLASLVEKETGSKEERSRIASVFVNRLRLNIPLQCDPTTVYAALLENRYKGVIHRSDLMSASPYNTYAHAGLPPGPIANPGVLSMSAALHPAASDYLYFVANAGQPGTHHFSRTLKEHDEAVASYRKSLR